MEEKFYSIRAVADQLGLKTRTVREWIRTGRLAGIKYGNSNRWYVSKREVERLKGANTN